METASPPQTGGNPKIELQGRLDALPGRRVSFRFTLMWFNRYQLQQRTIWKNGPSFLNLPEDEWPEEQPIKETNEAVMSKLIKNMQKVTPTLASAKDYSVSFDLSKIIYCYWFGDLDSLLPVTSNMLRFINNIRNIKQKKQMFVRRTSDNLSTMMNLMPRNWINRKYFAFKRALLQASWVYYKEDNKWSLIEWINSYCSLMKARLSDVMDKSIRQACKQKVRIQFYYPRAIP